MEHESSVWTSTLEEFGEQVIGSDSITGAVSVAAISATMAVHVLRMVLQIAIGKAGLLAERPKLEELLANAQSLTVRLKRSADEDRAAYTQYVAAAQMPSHREEERAARTEAMRSALENATRTPLTAARSAVSGIELCAEAAALTRGAVAADIGGAACLLEGAVRAMLTSVDENLARIKDGKVRAELTAEREGLERKAVERTSAVKGSLQLS